MSQSGESRLVQQLLWYTELIIISFVMSLPVSCVHYK